MEMARGSIEIHDWNPPRTGFEFPLRVNSGGVEAREAGCSRVKHQLLETERSVLTRQTMRLTPALALLAFLPTASLQASATEGVASYYGDRFDGRRTASGARFDKDALTAAHRTLEFGTRVQVTNQSNGRSVDVVINDRGPFSRGRTIDLSKAAARKIGMLGSGVARVRLEVIEEGRSHSSGGDRVALAEAERLLIDLF